MTVSSPTTSVRRIFDESGQATEQSAPMSPIAATVATIMTRTVYCVEPDVGVDLLAGLLLKYNVSGLPVVDDRGRPMGVVTKTDLLTHLHEQAGDTLIQRDEADLLAELGGGYHAVAVDGTTVRDIMMPIVFAVAEDAPIAKAAALMAGERIHRLPILDRTGAVCGILSALDIVRWLADQSGYQVRP